MVDHFRRKLFLKNELKRVLVNSIINNNEIPVTYRYYAQFNKSKLLRFSSITQQKNKCVKTGRV